VKYFVAVEEDLVMKLWMKDPSLVAPLSRPFFPRRLNLSLTNQSCQLLDIEIQDLVPVPETLDLARPEPQLKTHN